MELHNLLGKNKSNTKVQFTQSFLQIFRRLDSVSALGAPFLGLGFGGGSLKCVIGQVELNSFVTSFHTPGLVEGNDEIVARTFMNRHVS